MPKRAQSTIEYLVLLAIAVAAIIGFSPTFRGRLNTGFTHVYDEVLEMAGSVKFMEEDSAAPPSCTYTYSDWGECQSNNTQTRTAWSASPSGCVGTPILSQSCTYVPPPQGEVGQSCFSDNSCSSPYSCDRSENICCIPRGTETDLTSCKTLGSDVECCGTSTCVSGYLGGLVCCQMSGEQAYAVPNVNNVPPCCPGTHRDGDYCIQG